MTARTRAGRRRLSRWNVLAVLIGSAIVGVCVFGLSRALFGSDQPVPTPAGANMAGGFPLGPADARARVDIYLDPQCAECRGYLDSVQDILDKLVTEGRAQVVYHPLALYDRDSSTRYPTRATAAAGCAAESGVYAAFQRALLANQPPAGSAGLPEQRLIEFGRQAGAGEPFAECVRDRRFEPWVSKTTSRAYNLGVRSVPTVLVDDSRIAATDRALREAVAAVR